METVARVPKYEAVAEKIQQLIDEGVYEPGDRLPSIRELHEQFRVSINTVREAYRLLESRGTAEAVSQSGHFVRQGPPLCLEECMDYPDVLESSAQKVGTDRLTRMVVTDSGHPGWVNLSTAEPDARLLPTRQIVELTSRAIRKDPLRAIGYELPDGPLELRQEIAKRLFRGGVTVSPEEILITAGCLEAVFIALATTCEPGDTVIVESPAFYLFYQLLAQLKLKALEVPSHCCDGVDLDDLEHVLRRHGGRERITAALLIGNFTNPMGSLMPEENKRSLAALLSRHGVTLIEDDMYGELYYSGGRPDSIAAHSDPELTYLAASFSKTIAPGFRVGWLAAGERLIGRARHTKLVTSIVTSKPAALGVAAFLENGAYDRTLRTARRVYRHNASRLRELVDESFPKGTTSSRPLGGMVLWVAMPKEVEAVRLYEVARKEGISFAPGPMFALSDSFANCLRLNLSVLDDRVEHAVRRLGAMAHRLISLGEASA